MAYRSAQESLIASLSKTNDGMPTSTTVWWMLQTYTGYSMLWTLIAFGLPCAPLCFQKVVGVNLLSTCFVDLLHSSWNYYHPSHAMIVRSFYLHVLPIFPGVLWYRHADSLTRNGWDVHPGIRVLLNIVLFAVWGVIPYHHHIALHKIKMMYHNPQWWTGLVLLACWSIFHAGLGRLRRRTIQRPSRQDPPRFIDV